MEKTELAAAIAEGFARGIARALDGPAKKTAPVRRTPRRASSNGKPKTVQEQVQELLPFIRTGEEDQAPPTAEELNAYFNQLGERSGRAASPPPPGGFQNPPLEPRGAEYEDATGDAPENTIAGIQGINA